MSRDRDIRNAMRTLLLATNAFDDVLIGRDTEDYAASAVGGNTCKIVPLEDRQKGMWDEGDELEMVVKVKLIFGARNEDPQIRDEEAERLYNVARNTLNDVSIASLTMPAFTGFDSAKWMKPEHPSRQIETIFIYRYFVDDNTYDVTE
jgi:hypothetical protein